MKINEIFYSIQGEGFLTGVPSVFIRTAGCPLRCKWCDTRHAWSAEAGDYLTIKQILQRIKHYPADRIVITGGEPVHLPALGRLTEELKNHHKHITIETAGIKFVPDLKCDLMSISPKLSNALPPNADRADYLNIDTINKLINNYEYQLKFVIDTESDIHEILDLLDKLKNADRDRLFLMPQAATRSDYIRKAPLVARLCTVHNFRFSSRLQVLLWDNSRGT